MLQDLDAQRAIYSLDRNGFIQLMTLQCAGAPLLGAFLVRDNGDVVVQSDTGMESHLPPPTKDSLEKAPDGKPVSSSRRGEHQFRRCTHQDAP